MLLLSFQQQQQIKKISTNAADKYEKVAQEVEDSDLLALLGASMVYDLQENQTTEANISLLDGAIFEDCEGNTVKHKGLRYILAYLNFAAYLRISSITDTDTGLVKQLKNQQSEHATNGEVRAIQDAATKLAMTQFDLVKQFLNKNAANYPLWNVAKSKSPSNFRIIPVKNTLR